MSDTMHWHLDMSFHGSVNNTQQLQHLAADDIMPYTSKVQKKQQPGSQFQGVLLSVSHNEQ